MREPFDDATKAFYRSLFLSWGFTVETECEVFFRGRAIDLVVCCTDADRVRVQDTVFAHFRRLNALELKEATDPLTLADYNRIMMRAWGLGVLARKETKSKNKPDPTDQLPSQRTVTIVCVTRPNRILDRLRDDLKFLPTDEPGIYLCDERLPQWIIYPTELTLVSKNYPLLSLVPFSAPLEMGWIFMVSWKKRWSGYHVNRNY